MNSFYAIVLLLTAQRIITTCLCVDFVRTPGMVRAYREGPATFTWELDQDVNFATSASLFYFQHPNYPDPFYVRQGSIIWRYGYNQRTNVTFEGSRKLGFTLYQLSAADTEHSYRCILALGPVGNPYDNNARLFLYETPSVPSITPNPAITIEGSRFTLTCTAVTNSVPREDAPAMTYTWTRGGQGIPGGAGESLTFNNVTRADHGQYECGARETGSELSNTGSILLNVQYKPGVPTIQGPPGPLEEGTQLNLTCTVSTDGNPATYTYSWWDDGKLRYTTESQNSLRVNDVTVADHDGAWRCEVDNTIGAAQSGEISVIVHAPAQIHTEPSSHVSRLVNETLSVLCKLKARPAADISWAYGGDLTLPSGVQPQSGQSTENGKYTITSSTLQWRPGSSDADRRNSAGIYICHGTNGVGDVATSGDFTLTVLYGPLGIALSDPGPITAVEGDPRTVTCSSECSPSCTYTWTRSDDVTWEHDQPTLSFTSIDSTDHNNYTCQSSNSYGSKETSLNITVNFASEITDFSASSDNILHGDVASLVCTVSSRPESVVTISNQTKTLLESSGYRDEYTFSPISILDSGDYRCTADNRIPPGPVQRTESIDVKGGFNHCDTDSSRQYRTTGVGLNTKFEQSICQFANPFYSITRNNWTFEDENGTRTDLSLPEDVMITLQATQHVYKKHIIFTIPAVTPSHYGTYTMTSGNQHGISLIFTLNITPKGPPEEPYDLVCTRTTAVSLYLQWAAGYHGGSEQTFLVKFSNLGTGVTMTSDVEGGDTPRGNSVQHVLTENDGIEPEQTYEIRVDVRNEYGTTAGPRVTNSTLARSEFIGEPTIIIDGNTAYINWTLSNPESLSHIVVSACDTSDADNCITTNITDPRLQPYQAAVPAADSFMFAFLCYDGEDRVNEFKHGTPIPGGSSNLTIIVGAVVGVVVAAALVFLLVMLWRKGIFVKRHTSKPEKAVHYENMTVGVVGGVEQENRTHTDVQYEDVGNLAFSPDGPDTKVYEGLIGKEINKTPVVYEAYEGDKTEMAQYRPSDIRPGDVISRGSVFCVQAAVILRGRHKEKARNIVTKQIVATNAEMFKRYLVEAARVLNRLVECQHVVVCAGMAGDSLLMENMPLGNLRHNLKGMADQVYANIADVKQKECLGFVLQIIAGLKAIVSQKPSPLFYCLSTDHVLVGQGQVCKLMGFNTADCVRQREEWEQQQGTPRPVRWLAPEAIDLRHVPESDIWAFGVLVWEILNFGLEPYTDYEDQQVVDFVKRGHRHLEMPPPTPTDMRDLVTQCWMISPTKRHTIMEISDVLGGLHI